MYFIGMTALSVAELIIMIVLIKIKTISFLPKVLIIIIIISTFLLTIYYLLIPNFKRPEPTGKYQVATADYFYEDENRVETYKDDGSYRKLAVTYWYPENSVDKFPLAVFSHGAGGVKESNTSLYTELASRGYVVCAIDHTYQCMTTKDKDGNKIGISGSFLKEMTMNDSSDVQASYALYNKWMDVRTKDINYVLDTIIDSTVTCQDKVFSEIDVHKIGLIGHSLGGSAALGVGRTRDDITTVVALESPFMCDIEGVDNGQFVWNADPYPVPVLNVYTDSSWSHLGEWKQYAKNYQLLKNPQEDEVCYNAYIKGAGHMNLTDLGFTSPAFCVIFGQKIGTDSTEQIESVNKICVDWFDSYLKGIKEFSIDPQFKQ